MKRFSYVTFLFGCIMGATLFAIYVSFSLNNSVKHLKAESERATVLEQQRTSK